MKRLDHAQQDQRDHIVDDGSRDDELPAGRVQLLANLQDVQGDGHGGWRQGSTHSEGLYDVDAGDPEGEGGADPQRERTAYRGHDQPLAPDLLEHGQVDLEAGLQDQQQQAHLADEGEGQGEGHHVQQLWAEHHAHDHLPDQAGDLDLHCEFAYHPRGEQEDQELRRRGEGWSLLVFLECLL